MYIPPSNPNQNPNSKKTTKAVIVFLIIFVFMFSFPIFAMLDAVFMAGDGFFFIIPFFIIPIIVVLGIVSVIVKILKSAKTGFQTPIDLTPNSKEQTSNQEVITPTETSADSSTKNFASRVSSFMGLSQDSINAMEKKIVELEQVNKSPNENSPVGISSSSSQEIFEKKQEPIQNTPTHSYNSSTGERTETISVRMITCSGCRKKIREDAKYCGYCGEPSTKICPVCQRENPRSNRYCTYCKSRM